MIGTWTSTELSLNMTFEDDFPFPHFPTWRVIMIQKNRLSVFFVHNVGPKDLFHQVGRFRFFFYPMDVSKNRGTPKSSILIGFSIINHPFWGTLFFGNTPIINKRPIIRGKRWTTPWRCLARGGGVFLITGSVTGFGKGRTSQRTSLGVIDAR